MTLWLLVSAFAAGSVGAFVDALAGMGFGVVSSSVLVAAGIPPALAVLTVNLAKIGSGFLSGSAHWRFGNVRWTWVIPLALPGLVGAIAGAFLLVRLPADAVRVWVPGLLLLMGLLILFRFSLVRLRLDVPPVAGASQDWVVEAPQGFWPRVGRTVVRMPSFARLMGIGFMAGTVNGVSGAYGPFATSSVLLAEGGHPRYAIGTVSLVEFLVAGGTSATLLLRLDWGALFHWQLPLALMAGGLLTAPLGAYLCRRLPARFLGSAVGVVLIGINLSSIWRAIV